MQNKLIVTFDKSKKDIPVLTVRRDTYVQSGVYMHNVISMFTGEKAEKLWDILIKGGDQE